MRYDTSIYMSLNESIRQIGSREHAISIIENIVNDIFHRADVLLESEEFFVEFYEKNKLKLNNFLTENVLSEEEFVSRFIPLMVENILRKIWGEKQEDIQADISKRAAGVKGVSSLADRYNNPELSKKAEQYLQRNYDILGTIMQQRYRSGLLGKARMAMDWLKNRESPNPDLHKMVASVSPEEKEHATRKLKRKEVEKAGERVIQKTVFDKQPSKLKGEGSVKNYQREIEAGKQYFDYLGKTKDQNLRKRRLTIAGKAKEITDKEVESGYNPKSKREIAAYNRRIDLANIANKQNITPNLNRYQDPNLDGYHGVLKSLLKSRRTKRKR